MDFYFVKRQKRTWIIEHPNDTMGVISVNAIGHITATTH